MTAPNTPVDVEALEAVARTATPGPWFVDGKRRSGAGAYTIWGPDGIGGGTIGSCDGATLAYRADNAAFIATFDPPTVLRLLAERREMLEALKRLGSMEPFALENGIWPGPFAEISARIEFARALILSALPEGKGE